MTLQNIQPITTSVTIYQMLIIYTLEGAIQNSKSLSKTVSFRALFSKPSVASW